MKIYVIRHEDRTMDATFFSPLTKIGLENSVKLIDVLEKEKINLIYSSPYIRTLQTIYPYLKKSGIKPKLDYSVVEFYQEENIPKKSYKITLPEYLQESFNYDNSYKTLIEPKDIEFPENLKTFNKRIKFFLKNIIEENYKTDNNILISTHQGVIEYIHKIIKKNNKLTINNFDKYPKGAITQIFENNKWVFNKINW
jgi:broad specificity phosphatase PhoE